MKEANDNKHALIESAVGGNADALEKLLAGIQDMVFNLSLRMLGTIPDAEDAAQEILVRVMTNLGIFRRESDFQTWVYRIAVNYLLNYKKSMFAHQPLDFEFYGNDIKYAALDETEGLIEEESRQQLAEELKLSCTNVMLQCLDPESRCIFILGTMFRIDSRAAGEVLGISPEAYRQRFSRVRRKMAGFLEEYCGEYGCGGCRCADRVQYAIQTHRIDPGHLDYTAAEAIPAQTMLEVKDAMEEIDGLAQRFSFCKAYAAPEGIARFLKEFLQSTALSTIKQS